MLSLCPHSGHWNCLSDILLSVWFRKNSVQTGNVTNGRYEPSLLVGTGVSVCELVLVLVFVRLLELGFDHLF